MTPTRSLPDTRRPCDATAMHLLRRSIPAVLCAALAATVFIAGCSTGNKADTSRPDNGVSEAAASETSQNRSEQLEALYLVGPRPALDLNYRIVWQSTVRPSTEDGFKIVYLTEDSVYALDHRNHLARLAWDNGQLRWLSNVAGPIESVNGMIYLDTTDRVYVTTDGQMNVIDNQDGEVAGRQSLGETASTGPVQYGQHLIYGSPSGRLAWHSYGIGQMWRAYQVSNTLRIRPVIYGNIVFAAGQDGIVSAIHAPRVSRLWQYRALSGIVARPVAANNVLYVSSLDQYIRAFEASSGRTLWAYLSRSPLETSPVVIGDRVYQYVPDEGVICFEARPRNAPGGRLIWSSPDAVGEVVTMVGDRILAWDGETQTATVLAASTGDVVKRIALPGVTHLRTTSRESGELIAVSADGRVIRLAPRAGR